MRCIRQHLPECQNFSSYRIINPGLQTWFQSALACGIPLSAVYQNYMSFVDWRNFVILQNKNPAATSDSFQKLESPPAVRVCLPF